MRQNKAQKEKCLSVMSKTTKADILHDIDYTQSNCSYIQKRLNKWDIYTKIYIVEYSLFSIFFSMLPKYFSLRTDILALLDFASISVSIVMLVVSLYVSLANYQKRAESALDVLNQLKKMKKDIAAIPEDRFTKKIYEKKSKRYYDIVQKLEIRDDLDFFRTCKANPKSDYPHPFGFWQEAYYRLAIVWNFIFPIIIFLIPFTATFYFWYMVSKQ